MKIAYLHLTIDSISATSPATRAAWTVAPISAPLAVRTVASHVASVTTDTANNASRKVLTLRAVVLAMANLSAVLTGLIFVISKGAVKGSKFAKLVSLEFVLTLRDGSRLYQGQKCHVVQWVR